MGILHGAQGYDVIITEGKMAMSFRGSPTTSIHGCRRPTLHADGRIIEEVLLRSRDDIFENVPGFPRVYRQFTNRWFG